MGYYIKPGQAYSDCILHRNESTVPAVVAYKWAAAHPHCTVWRLLLLWHATQFRQQGEHEEGSNSGAQLVTSLGRMDCADSTCDLHGGYRCGMFPCSMLLVLHQRPAVFRCAAVVVPGLAAQQHFGHMCLHAVLCCGLLCQAGCIAVCTHIYGPHEELPIVPTTCRQHTCVCFKASACRGHSRRMPLSRVSCVESLSCGGPGVYCSCRGSCLACCTVSDVT